ncbi:hypothetical protein [Lacicoccus alkaliphilus]|uniref:Uncharacterized protein n=1 Tax=Lacicoccus alkaliphilus DSM 16010 TaxID=1123231 RepID=A0A1M7JAE3_9BACL|nr:hypothetical protein [Salinicoccus alkaliphilus]SHM49972.1 hypothetical protein SAMN02745189_02269 [Salinicoccus alkaliphilus DSM 16010]
MKKILLVVALILFTGGLYVNFAMQPSVEQAGSMEETETSAEFSANDEKGPDETSGDEEETANDGAAESAPEAEIAFNQETLDDIHDEAVQNNEVMIIDVLLPEYYSDAFIGKMEETFETGTIQFNRLEIDGNTTDLSALEINGNSDAVIIDALQIRDYNDGVLPARDREALGVAYVNIYNTDRTVFLLGNPGLDEDGDGILSEVLGADETYFTANDYYYIDNQEIEAEGAMTPEAEDEIIENIYDYLISAS